jgi:hypothetical protein
MTMLRDAKVIPFPTPAAATLAKTERPNRVIVKLGKQHFACDIWCHLTRLPPVAAPVVAVKHGVGQTSKGPRP